MQGRDKWVESVDASSGYTYYYNEERKQSVWEKPADFDALAKLAQAHANGGGLSDSDDADASRTRRSQRKESRSTTIGLESPTIGLESPTIGLESTTIGLESTTIGLESTTIGLESTTSTASGKETDGSSDWVALVDEGSGYTYYYNNATEETSWELPEGFWVTPANAMDGQDETDTQRKVGEMTTRLRAQGMQPMDALACTNRLIRNGHGDAVSRLQV
jgi:hypothetical protein